MKLSLWLRPDDPARTAYREKILQLSQHREGSSAPFEPHITLLGGIECNEEDLEALKIRLEERIKGFGAIFCQLLDRPYFAPVWNQAAVMVVKESHELGRLVQESEMAVEGL